MGWRGFAGCVCSIAALIFATPSYGGEYSFAVKVALSQKASAELAARKEAIVVWAYFEGEPIPGREKFVIEDGPELIWLGSERVMIPGASGNAVLTGKNVKRSRIGWVKQFNAQISISTARLSGPSNLLDCGYFEESVATLRKAPVTIFCKLIGEP